MTCALDRSAEAVAKATQSSPLRLAPWQAALECSTMGTPAAYCPPLLGEIHK